MGGSQSTDWAHDEESLTEPGQKSVISGPIDGVEADALFAAFEKYVRLGKVETGREAKFEMQTTDDNGVLCLAHFSIPEIFGGGDFATRTVFKFDQPNRKIQAALTIGDVYWERKLINSIGHIVIHSDPARLEFWSVQPPMRSSGKFLRSSLLPIFKAMGLDVEIKIETPSISDPSKMAVVTDPIVSSDLTPENFLQKFKEALINECGGVELPDGSVAEDRSGLLEIFKSFAKHEFEADKAFIYEYGEDESFSILRSINHLRVHKDPLRLEAWCEAMEGRYASEPEKKFMADLTDKVLKFMKEGA